MEFNAVRNYIDEDSFVAWAILVNFYFVDYVLYVTLYKM